MSVRILSATVFSRPKSVPIGVWFHSFLMKIIAMGKMTKNKMTHADSQWHTKTL